MHRLLEKVGVFVCQETIIAKLCALLINCEYLRSPHSRMIMVHGLHGLRVATHTRFPSNHLMHNTMCRMVVRVSAKMATDNRCIATSGRCLSGRCMWVYTVQGNEGMSNRRTIRSADAVVLSHYMKYARQ